MRPTAYPLRVGADTLTMYIPCTVGWRVPNVQTGKAGRMAVYGGDWHLYHVYTPGGTYWRLTVHSRDHGRQLITANNLLPRLDEIFRTINLPPHLLHAIHDGKIGFSRVDIATDFSFAGYIPLDADEIALCARYRRTVEIYEGEHADTLYIRMPGGSVRQCRYDKSLKWKLDGLPRRYWRVPTSRLEYRFHGREACIRAGVRTLSGLLSVLSGWAETLADNRQLWHDLLPLSEHGRQLARRKQRAEKKKRRPGKGRRFSPVREKNNNLPARSLPSVSFRAYNNTPLTFLPVVKSVGRRPHGIPSVFKYPKFKCGRSPPARFLLIIR